MLKEPASGISWRAPMVGGEKIGTPSTPRLTADEAVTGMYWVPEVLAASAARIWRSIAPFSPPNWPSALFIWDAAESFIQTGTYWFTIRLRNVRKTRRAMIVPTVEATPSSSPRRSRIRRRMKSPGEKALRPFYRPILDDAIYRCRAENLTLRMSRFSPYRRGPFSSSIFDVILTSLGGAREAFFGVGAWHRGAPRRPARPRPR